MGADLEDANLKGANLTNTVLDEKKKQETKMNMEIRWAMYLLVKEY
jgi:uncharacterized protein YjbI with pentapeptide repeats